MLGATIALNCYPHYRANAHVKTTVSIPDRVFKSSEELARRLDVSRSRLYTLALQRFVQEHDDEATTAKLDQVYANESSALDPIFQSIQSRSVKKRSIPID